MRPGLVWMQVTRTTVRNIQIKVIKTCDGLVYITKCIHNKDKIYDGWVHKWGTLHTKENHRTQEGSSFGAGKERCQKKAKTVIYTFIM